MSENPYLSPPSRATPKCRNCGYDLSGLDRSGICPECGEDINLSTTPRPLAELDLEVLKRFRNGALYLSYGSIGFGITLVVSCFEVSASWNAPSLHGRLPIVLALVLLGALFVRQIGWLRIAMESSQSGLDLAVKTNQQRTRQTARTGIAVVLSGGILTLASMFSETVYSLFIYGPLGLLVAVIICWILLLEHHYGMSYCAQLSERAESTGLQGLCSTSRRLPLAALFCVTLSVLIVFAPPPAQAASLFLLAIALVVVVFAWITGMLFFIHFARRVDSILDLNRPDAAIKP